MLLTENLLKAASFDPHNGRYFLQMHLNHSLIHNFETVPNSKKLQLKYGYQRVLRFRLHRKHCGKKCN